MRPRLIIVILLPVLSYGQQNLVPNGDFEEYANCPDSPNQWFNALNWINPTGGSPDYFHSCAPPLIFFPDTFPHMGTPANVVGYQIPHSGDAYMGIFCMHTPQAEGREYIQSQLIDSIVASVRYIVSFHVSAADNYRLAISTLGAYLSKDAISREDYYRLEVEPQILNSPLTPLTDTANWVLITDTFSSRYGGERYLTIGNFHTDAASDSMLYNPSEPYGNRDAYYYIDDVSVVAIDSIPSSIEEPDGLSFSVFPNPATEVLHISSKQRLAHVRLSDLSGKTVLTESIDTGRHTVGLVGIPPGLYLLEAQDTEGRRAMQKVMVQ